MKSISDRLNRLIDNENTVLQGFQNYSLKNIEYILKYFGNPHKKIKSVHIAGTNGKGSVAYMLRNILSDSGYRVGLYTSPHLTKINERININFKDITDKKLNIYIEELFDLLDKENEIHPTYFDALTLFAFRYFHEQGVDISIIETGLGGRLDSTNVISPEISIITDISYDHKDVLGNTIKEIASEKAGIIKSKSMTITSNTKKDILEIISYKAKEYGSNLYILNRNFSTKNIRYSKKTGFIFDFYYKNYMIKNEITHSTNKKEQLPLSNDFSIKEIPLNNKCRFQIKNSSLVIAASLLLNNSGFKIKEANIKKGIAGVEIPGRFQILSQSPLIIFDPAHNIDALKSIIQSLKEGFPDKVFSVLLSFMMDKEYLSMLEIIKKDLTDDIYYYELQDDRSLKVSDQIGTDKTTAYNNLKIFSNINDLTNNLQTNLDNKSSLFITGSFRLFNIAKSISEKLTGDKT